ncbi:MAG: PEP/pyruvate-binding domain-containing protein, partial [Candidatus Omnitrophota bacterium]
ISGTMNTYEPVGKNKGIIEIKAGLGLGAVVAGQGEPAQALVNKVTGRVEMVNSTSQAVKKLIIDEKGHFDSVDITAEEARVPILSEDLVRRLAEIGKELERMNYSWTQDVEWVVTPDDKIHIVQTRSIPEALLYTEVFVFDVNLNNFVLPELTDEDLKMLDKLREENDIAGLFEQLASEKREGDLVAKDMRTAAKRSVAINYLVELLKQKSNREKLTQEHIAAIKRVTATGRALGWPLFAVLGYLADTPYAEEIKDYILSYENLLKTVIPHPGKLDIAEGAFMLGLYDKAIEGLDAVGAIGDMTRSVAARTIDIAERHLLGEVELPKPARENALAFLRQFQERYRGEWVSDQMQLVINRMIPAEEAYREEIAAEAEAPIPAAVTAPEGSPAAFMLAGDDEGAINALFDQIEAEGTDAEIEATLSLEVTNTFGLHMRPARLIKMAIEKAGVKGVIVGGPSDGMAVSSEIPILMLAAGTGDEFKLTVTGKEKDVNKFMAASRELLDMNKAKAIEKVFKFKTADIKKAEPVIEVPVTEKSVDDLLGEFTVTVGMSGAVMKQLGVKGSKEIERETGVKLVWLESTTSEDMIAELDKETRGSKTIAALLDISPDKYDFEEIKGIVRDFAQKTKRDVIELMYPHIAELTPANVKKAQGIAALKNIAAVLARLLPETESYRITEKSIYDLRLHNIYENYRVSYTSEALAKMNAFKAKEDLSGDRHYVVTAIESAGDMRMLADSIRERRQALEVVKPDDDPIQDIVLIRNAAIQQDLGEYMEATGLDQYVPAGQINFVEEGGMVTLEEIQDIVQQVTLKPVLANEIAVGARSSIIDLETPGAMDILSLDRKDRMLLVRMEDGLVSQLYKMTIEILSNNDQEPMTGIDGVLDRIGKYNLFNYLPKVEAVDMKEMRDYEQRIRTILVAA